MDGLKAFILKGGVYVDFTIPYVRSNGKNTYLLDLQKLPENCYFETIPAVAWVKFGVDNIKERSENPGMPDVTIENLYGEKCKITRQELITSVVRLSGNRIKMSIIDSERDYEGIYVGIIKGIKLPFTKKEEEPKEENESNGDGEEKSSDGVQRLLPEFMDKERHESLKAIFIPKNCKAFYEGEVYKGNHYIVFTPDSEDSTFKVYTAVKFKKLFMVPEQDNLDILSELKEKDTFNSNEVKALLNKEQAYKKGQEANSDLDLSELDDSDDPFAGLAGAEAEETSGGPAQSIAANLARQQSMVGGFKGSNKKPMGSKPQARNTSSNIGECEVVARVFKGNKLDGFIIKRASGKEIEKNMQTVIDMCKRGQITNLKIDKASGKMVGNGIKISQLPIRKSSSQN